MGYNILDRDVPVYGLRVVDASAGTGKTFAIAHMYVRLLIEKNELTQELPVKLEEILVVTFTREAVRELKSRIRQTIEYSVSCLQDSACNDDIPDYLLSVIEQGAKSIREAKRLLEHALFRFSDAQIFTIHGFCARVLSDQGLLSNSGIYSQSDALIRFLRERTYDYLRFAVSTNSFCVSQIDLILKNYRNDVNRLVPYLLNIACSSSQFTEYLSYSSALVKFQSLIEQPYWQNFVSCNLEEEFQVYSLAYKGLRHRDGTIKDDVGGYFKQLLQLLSSKESSEDLFIFFIRKGLPILSWFDSSNKKVKVKQDLSKLKELPLFLERLEYDLSSIISESRELGFLLCRMGRELQDYLKNSFHEYGVHTPDALLELMRDSVRNDSFVQSIRKSLKVGIVDEFQDTDLLQWEIFECIFIRDSSHSNFCIVGDPKQAIYAFRNADVYTYLQAVDQIGETYRVTLDVNFRSQPLLLQGLNFLFGKKALNLFSLPKAGLFLDYTMVKAGRDENSKLIADNKGSVHLFVCSGKASKIGSWPSKSIEEEFLFPFLVKEILSLKKQGCLLSEVAVLIRDRFQGERLMKVFSSARIPFVSRRGYHIKESVALGAIRDFFLLLMNFRDRAKLNTVLLGPIFGFSFEQMESYEEDELLAEKLVYIFRQLKQEFLQNGIFSCIESLLRVDLFYEETLEEKLLNSEFGQGVREDLVFLGHILSMYQEQTLCLLGGIVRYLDEISSGVFDDDETLRRPSGNDGEEAVQIMTTHISKGLEFPFVFTLGLASRDSASSRRFLVNQGGSYKATSKQDVEGEDVKEADTEKLRQLYVGMTRASERLYIPIVIDDQQRELTLGSASPLELFIGSWCASESTYEAIYLALAQLNLESFYSLAEAWHKEEPSITYETIPKDVQKYIVNDDSHEVGSLIEVQREPILEFSNPVVRSFSSILSQEKRSMEESFAFPSDVTSSSIVLPLGVETGLVFHELLEKLPFFSAEHEIPSELVNFVNKTLSQTSLQEYESVFIEILKTLSKITFFGEFHNFSLPEIDLSKSYREMEFIYKDQDEGYLRGSIDFIFQYDSYYYVLDWKTNYLGALSEDYHPKKVAEYVKKMGYLLQAKIYSEAAAKHFGFYCKDTRKLQFGGVIFCFLRGVSMEHPGHGICAVSPREIDQLEDEPCL